MINLPHTVLRWQSAPMRLKASTSWEQQILLGCSAACLSVTTHLTQVTTSCSQALASARLEAAAELLKSAGAPPLAPKLQANISNALTDLRPASVLDQLIVRLVPSCRP